MVELGGLIGPEPGSRAFRVVTGEANGRALLGQCGKVVDEIHAQRAIWKAESSSLKKRRPFHPPQDLQRRTDLFLELLTACSRQDKKAFLRITAAHASTIDRIKPLRETARLLEAEQTHSEPWRCREVLAAKRATEHAYRGTKEWRIRFSEILDTGPYLARLVPALEKKLALLRLDLRRELARHKQQVRASVDETLMALGPRVNAAVLEAEACVKSVANFLERDRQTVAVIQRPWVVVNHQAALVWRRAPALTDLDLTLAREWSSGSVYEDAKMRSARRAEKLALEVYSGLYGRAEDLSILQLTSPEDSRWHTADVEAGGHLIDVKNARRSFSSPDSYSEHSVKTFKDATRGREVKISGFLSTYAATEEAEEDSEIVWLGETSGRDIRALASEFTSDHLEISFLDGKGSLLPPWLFDYPEVFYDERKAAVEEIRSEGFSWPVTNVPLAARLVAKSTIARGGPGAIESPSPEALEEVGVLEARLRSFQYPTRPFLFLHILDRFCACAVQGAPFPADAIKKVLFSPDFPAWSSILMPYLPLAVLDPLATIRNLLRLLRGVSISCAERSLAFRSFRLRGPNILQGRTGTNEWQTIYAYCGGWGQLSSGGPVRCGQNPLYLGQAEPCPACRHLVCHRCGFCSQLCPDCSGRQSEWNDIERTENSGEDRRGSVSSRKGN
jgi:hypothetical protein